MAKPSFKREISAALEYFTQHPESIGFVREALSVTHASNSLTRWRDLSTKLTEWQEKFGFGVIYYISKQSQSLPRSLKNKYPESADRLEELRTLYGEDMEDAFDAYQNPLGLQMIYHRFKRPELLQGPVVLQRNDGEKLAFHFEADDIAFLATSALEMVVNFVENKGEFEKGWLESLRETLASAVQTLTSVGSDSEVASTREK